MAGTARTTRTARPASRPETEPEDRDEDLFEDDAENEDGADNELDEDDLFDDDDLDDELDGARSGYVTMDDLKGRLLLCKPASTGTRESKIKNQDPYEYVVNEVVIVLDGDETEMIDSLPYELEDFQLWGTNVVSTLKPKIRSGKWVVGRLKTRKAKSYNTPAWYLEEPDEDDFAEAKTALKDYKIKMRNKGKKTRR